MDCLGCKLANKIDDVHVVFEDDFVCCILDHSPYKIKQIPEPVPFSPR